MCGASSITDASGIKLNYGLSDASLTFTITHSAPPPVGSGAPSGTVPATRPVFIWPAVSGASDYQLYFGTTPGPAIINQWYTAAQAACGVSACTVTSPAARGLGSYTWWVRPQNTGGPGPWSAGMAFTVVPLAPGMVTLITPVSGAGTDQQPTYAWTKDNLAAWYYLEVRQGSASGTQIVGQWFSAAACGGASCTATPAMTLTAASHTWKVVAWNASGLGPWSSPATFTAEQRNTDPSFSIPSGR